MMPIPAPDESALPTDDCIIILQDMHIVHASQSFSRLFGRPLDSIKGRNIKRFFQASSVLALEKYISTLRKGLCLNAPPLEIMLVGRETENTVNYSFHLGWIPYMDSGAVIGVLRNTKPKRAETASSHNVPSAWDTYLRELLTRLQVYERESCTILIPWALEHMHPLLNSDECILDIYIPDMEGFRCSYCWRETQMPDGMDNRTKTLDKPSSISQLAFEKPDIDRQDHNSRNYDELLRIPIRRNTKTLGGFSWHPQSPDDASVIDWEKFEIACTLLALKIWHQHCIEKAQASQQGFNEVLEK